MMTATFEKLTQGEVDEVAYEKFVAKETKRIQRHIDRGHRDFPKTLDARAAAESYCRVYRHQYRTQTWAQV